MKRVLLLLLCWVLPLQLAWAGAGLSVCGSAHGAEMQHSAHAPGHDGHDGHGAAVSEACCPDAAADCGHCHGPGTPLAQRLMVPNAPALAEALAAPPARRASAPPGARPERPNWAALA
jgi:hypothetical protein